jgi:hypothetical protein
MESLKEKTKKNARRCGMSKKGMVGLALGTVGLMGLVCSDVQAGSITGITPKKVAKELVDAAAVQVQNVIDDTTHKYRPTQIRMGELANPTIVLSVDNGKITVGPGGVAFCNSTLGEDGVIAQYKAGDGTNELVFSSKNSDIKIANNIDYYIKNSTCDGPADLTFEIPRGASSVTLKISAGSSLTQDVYDTASATIFSVVPQYSASVTKRLSGQIDYTYDFKKFTEDQAIDSGQIQLKEEDLDVKVSDRVTSHDANFIVTLKPTDMAGIASATIERDGFNVSCDKDVDKFICKAAYLLGSGDKDFKIYVNVTGTDVLSERKFTVDALLDFEDSKAEDRTLLTNAPFGEWTYRGTTIYVPLIGVNPTTGRETYIKLQSKDKGPSANKVRAIILASDGSTVTADLGQITAGQPFLIKGSDLAAKVEAAGKTVGDSFAAILVVTTDEANLFGYANIIDPSGVKRVPLKVRSGQIIE